MPCLLLLRKTGSMPARWGGHGHGHDISQPSLDGQYPAQIAAARALDGVIEVQVWPGGWWSGVQEADRRNALALEIENAVAYTDLRDPDVQRRRAKLRPDTIATDTTP